MPRRFSVTFQLGDYFSLSELKHQSPKTDPKKSMLIISVWSSMPQNMQVLLTRRMLLWHIIMWANTRLVAWLTFRRFTHMTICLIHCKALPSDAHIWHFHSFMRNAYWFFHTKVWCTLIPRDRTTHTSSSSSDTLLPGNCAAHTSSYSVALISNSRSLSLQRDLLAYCGRRRTTLGNDQSRKEKDSLDPLMTAGPMWRYLQCLRPVIRE